MRKFIFGLSKFAISIGLLALAFWPNGVGSYVMRNFGDHPVFYTVLVSIWGILLSLNLPLSRSRFTLLSTLCLGAIYVAVMFLLYQKGKFDVGDGNQWKITMIIFAGAILGWLPNASKVWRWYRGIYGVDDSDTGDNEYT